MPLEIKPIGAANLPDAARLCLAGRTLSDRPHAFTREVEIESTRCKLSYLRGAMQKGALALAAYRTGMLVGYVEAHAIGEALVPLAGEACHAITCLRVPELAERAEVEHELVAALAAALPASRGFAVVAREKIWSALTFEEIERSESEVDGFDRVVWWRPVAGGDPPKLVPVDRKLPKIPGKVRVDVFASDRCPWDRYVFDIVRQTCAAFKTGVVVYETDCTKRREVLRSGVTAAVAVNGRFQPWLRPHRLPDAHAVRRVIESAS
ncbi:MAG: hypothetical protein K8T90_03925 [Planctomycetes bacterium]|nr:hypothetical protein [Planctomycetota bacterium]